MTTPRERIDTFADLSGINMVVFDNLDDAIVGIVSVHTQPERVLYDHQKVLEILEEEMSHEDAVDYFGANIACLWAGESTPAILYRLEHLDDEIR